MTRALVLQPRAFLDLQELAKFYRAKANHNDVNAWLDDLYRSIESLTDDADLQPRAAESWTLRLDLRQKLYGSRRGKVRILFIIGSDYVRVLHVRHAARRPVTESDLT